MARTIWVGAAAFAVFGNALYLLLADHFAFVLGGLMALPLFALLVWRLPVVFGDDNSPWRPPSSCRNRATASDDG
jgi:hypothetical protein